jgi:hypothetical protein
MILLESGRRKVHLARGESGSDVIIVFERPRLSLAQSALKIHAFHPLDTFALRQLWQSDEIALLLKRKEEPLFVAEQEGSKLFEALHAIKQADTVQLLHHLFFS